MAKPITALLNKEMTRKEFMTTLGFMTASVMGLSGIIHLLTGKTAGHHLQQSSLGYGSSAYGGSKD